MHRIQLFPKEKFYLEGSKLLEYGFSLRPWILFDAVEIELDGYLAVLEASVGVAQHAENLMARIVKFRLWETCIFYSCQDTFSFTLSFPTASSYSSVMYIFKEICNSFVT